LESLPLPLLVCILYFFFFSFLFLGACHPQRNRSVSKILPVLSYPVYTVGNTKFAFPVEAPVPPHEHPVAANEKV
jgi:hypothetical protein